MRLRFAGADARGQTFAGTHRGACEGCPRLHNMTLIERTPFVYKPVRVKPPHPTWTFMRLVVGKGTAFEPQEIKMADFGDRAGQIALVVEAGEAVPWTKPEEWDYDSGQPLPPLFGAFNDSGAGKTFSKTCVGFADGSVRMVQRETSESVWRAIFELKRNQVTERPK